MPETAGTAAHATSEPRAAGSRWPIFSTAREWVLRTVVASFKRVHWIFRLGDVVRTRLEMQDRATTRMGELENVVRQYAQAQNTAAHLLRDVHQRLAHHENGPLQASKRELDRRRSDGMVRPIDAKRNGKRSQPQKTIDATGNVTDVAPGA